MQKGEISKLRLLATGIGARLDQNRAFFVSLCMQFCSGSKTFPAKVIMKEETDWMLHYQGVDRVVTSQDIVEFFVSQSVQYPEATLEYTERGKTTILLCSSRGVQLKQVEQKHGSDTTAEVANPLLDSQRQYLIRVDRAATLLKEIGILTKSGKLRNDRIRKYNQIDHYVELVAPMLQKDDDDELVLLDCACGKSYLSFVMNYYLREVLGKRCRIIGIDINAHVIEESRKMAQRLGYHNMEFLQADLREYIPPCKVTAVMSLHACDIATDLALATAIRVKAKYIACVPCCHKELLNQYDLPEMNALIRHGVFRARFNDVLTDSLRALRLEAEGYKVSVVEYVSPLDTPKNLLIRAVRTDKDNMRAQQEYQAIRRLLGTTSELDVRCEAMKNECFAPDYN